MLNKSIIEGRLTKDLELRKTPNGVSVVQFNLACDRPKRKDQESQADFLSCVAWRGTAEFLCNHMVKGDHIIVEARAQSRTYDGKYEKHYVTDFVIENVYPISWKKYDQERNDQYTRNDQYMPNEYSTGYHKNTQTYQTNKSNYQPTLSGGDTFENADFSEVDNDLANTPNFDINSDNLPFY